jgi:acyl transferase domain-containing protein
MARELYETEPTFAAEIDRAAAALTEHLGVDVREVLFPPAEEGAPSASGPGRQADLRALLRRGSGAVEASRPLDRTELAQPILFVVGHALARLLMAWGIRPQAMIGYSIGEYVAACLSGVLSLEDALALVARRAKLIQELPAGAMLAVPLPAAEVTPHLGESLSLSATNGPHFSVVGGPEEAVADLERRLSERGAACLRLTTTHAFHSRMLAPAAGALTGLARSLSPGEPAIPYLSNVTGTWITAADLGDAGYWARHMVQPVRFAEGLSELLREPELALLEVGPGSTLTTLVRQHPDAAGRIAVQTLRRESERGSDVAVLLEAAGRLWTAGVPLDPEGFFAHQRRRRVALPTYPFERQRCWIDPPPRTAERQPSRYQVEAADLADWFYLPGWRRTAPPVRTADPAAGPWLVFADRSGVGDRLADRLRREGREVVVVAAGESGAGHPYALDPGKRAAYGELVAHLREEGKLPRRVVHLWTIDDPVEPLPFARSQEPGLLSLLYLAQAMAEAGVSEPLHLTAVSTRLHQVVDGEPVVAEKAPLLAALKVLPQEYPHWTCRSVDVVPPSGAAEGERLLERLLAEAEAPGADFAVAWRGRDRWARAFDRVHLDEAQAPAGVRLRDAGVYLVTDGANGIGPALVEQLLRGYQARLAVVVPPGAPERDDWARLGGEVWTVAADLTDRAQVAALLDRVHERFGALHGVFHTVTATAGGLVQLKSAESLTADLAPQVEGARLLRELLRGRPVDFLLVCSSTLAVTGGFGQLESAAAGAFVDALALGEEGPDTFTVHWDPYQWAGWLAAGVGGGPLLSQEDLQKNLEVYGVSAAESAEALVRLLAAELPRVVVSARDLDVLIHQAEEITATTLMEQMEQARRTAPKHARQLATPYVAPGNDLEAEIAAAWEDFFGIAPIGIHDSFLELGGHSLLAIQVTTELRKRYEVDLPVTAVFESPTIAELAATITRARQEEEMQLEELLAAVEGLSPEEALRRMEEEIGTHA